MTEVLGASVVASIVKGTEGCRYFKEHCYYFFVQDGADGLKREKLMELKRQYLGCKNAARLMGRKTGAPNHCFPP